MYCVKHHPLGFFLIHYTLCKPSFIAGLLVFLNYEIVVRNIFWMRVIHNCRYWPQFQHGRFCFLGLFAYALVVPMVPVFRTNCFRVLANINILVKFVRVLDVVAQIFLLTLFIGGEAVQLYNKKPCAWLLWHWSSQGQLALCNPRGR